MIRLIPYVVRSAWRNPVRTVLTVLGVGFAILLVASLAAILDSRVRAVQGASATTLVVSERDVY